jgi:cyclic pyranopterin phosphate synthase
LKQAGLSRVTVSLDSLKRSRFESITGADGLGEVLRGIDAALEAGLTPLKVNTVVLKGVNDDEISSFAELSRTRKIEVRFIEFMPLGGGGWREKFLDAEGMEERLRASLPVPPEPIAGAGPAARRLALEGGGIVGWISPISAPFCGQCDRLRITSDGRIRPCLLEDGELDLKGPLREGAGDDAVLGLLRKAWNLKPDGHGIDSDHMPLHSSGCGGMRRIGG